MKVMNALEPIVFQIFNLDFLNKNKLTCTCDRCQSDIIALALNRLPTRYVATEEGNVYIKALFTDQQLNTDIVRELSNAVTTVKESPNH